MNTNIYLSTTRMFLRELTLNDHTELMDLDSDPEVMKYLTDGKPSTKNEIFDVIKRVEFLYQKYQHQFGVWAAIEKKSHQFMGWFLLRPCKKDPDNLQLLELGYRLKKQFWGQGFATEGSRELLNKAFNHFKVIEVFATTMKGNLNSQNVIKKIGLKFSHNYQEELFPGIDKSAVRYSLCRKNV